MERGRSTGRGNTNGSVFDLNCNRCVHKPLQFDDITSWMVASMQFGNWSSRRGSEKFSKGIYFLESEVVPEKIVTYIWALML